MPYVYTLESQTDFFAGYQTIPQFMEAVDAEPNLEGPSVATQKAVDWLEHCRDLLRQHTAWEGDVREDAPLHAEGIGAFPAPNSSRPHLLYIVKQHHNGATFVVSDVALPGIESSNNYFS